MTDIFDSSAAYDEHAGRDACKKYAAHKENDAYDENTATCMNHTPSNAQSFALPSLLKDSDLPGPLSLNRLSALGSLHKIDTASAYLTQDANTLYGRASIIAGITPKRAAACAMSAVWVWLGGDFSSTIDVISSSHFRALVYGRKIRVFNRKAPPEHLINIGDLKITTPARTACDLILIDIDGLSMDTAIEFACTLMQDYHFRPDDCLAILQANRYWRNAPRARAFFEKVRGCFR